MLSLKTPASNFHINHKKNRNYNNVTKTTRGLATREVNNRLWSKLHLEAVGFLLSLSVENINWSTTLHWLKKSSSGKHLTNISMFGQVQASTLQVLFFTLGNSCSLHKLFILCSSKGCKIKFMFDLCVAIHINLFLASQPLYIWEIPWYKRHVSSKCLRQLLILICRLEAILSFISV